MMNPDFPLAGDIAVPDGRIVEFGRLDKLGLPARCMFPWVTCSTSLRVPDQPSTVGPPDQHFREAIQLAALPFNDLVHLERQGRDVGPVRGIQVVQRVFESDVKPGIPLFPRFITCSAELLPGMVVDSAGFVSPRRPADPGEHRHGRIVSGGRMRRESGCGSRHRGDAAAGPGAERAPAIPTALGPLPFQVPRPWKSDMSGLR